MDKVSRGRQGGVPAHRCSLPTVGGLGGAMPHSAGRVVTQVGQRPSKWGTEEALARMLFVRPTRKRCDVHQNTMYGGPPNI